MLINTRYYLTTEEEKTTRKLENAMSSVKEQGSQTNKNSNALNNAFWQ